MRKVILTGILVGFSLAGCSTASSVTSPDVTGSYSTANLLPEKCHHTGPGWVTEPSELTDGVSFRVRDLYYCDNLTGGVITPGTGDKFNIYVPVTFSKTKPKEGS